jgi:hypothetical protein
MAFVFRQGDGAIAGGRGAIDVIPSRKVPENDARSEQSPVIASACEVLPTRGFLRAVLIKGLGVANPGVSGSKAMAEWLRLWLRSNNEAGCACLHQENLNLLKSS